MFVLMAIEIVWVTSIRLGWNDCRRAAVLVSAAATDCKGPTVVIDQKAAADGEGWRVTLLSPPTAASVRAERGERPWVPNRTE